MTVRLFKKKITKSAASSSHSSALGEGIASWVLENKQKNMGVYFRLDTGWNAELLII